MHELAITEEIVRVACAHAGPSPVRRVVVEIGSLTAVAPDAVRFCFDACRAGTALADAELHIVEIPGRGRCRRCGARVALAGLFARCGCGSADVEILAGTELRLQSLEVA